MSSNDPERPLASRRTFLTSTTAVIATAGTSANMAHADSLAPGMLAAEPPHRKALEAYATWLFYERRLVCADLYANLPNADDFVMCLNAGFHWHLSGRISVGERIHEATRRAEPVLAAVGVDWAAHVHREPQGLGKGDEVASRPANWPHVDAELIGASAELAILELGLDGLVRQLGNEADSHSQYAEIDERRNEVLATLISEPAQSEEGMAAKAEALKSPTVAEDFITTRKLAASLANDVIAFATVVAAGRA